MTVTFKKIYPYICLRCEQKRETRLYKRLKGSICMKCKRKKIADGQVSLFGKLFKGRR